MVEDFIPYTNLFEISRANFKGEHVTFWHLGLTSYNNNNKKFNKRRKKKPDCCTLFSDVSVYKSTERKKQFSSRELTTHSITPESSYYRLLLAIKENKTQ